MTGETSWTECATQVMEGTEQVWFTVQSIVTEVRERNMKPSMHRLPANEACRSLRSCLRHHAMKDNGRFVRKQSNSLILYALRKEGHTKKPRAKRSVASSRLKMNSNSGSPPPSPPPSCPLPLIGRPVIVEVDDPSLPKPYRPRHPRDWVQPGFLLPSPSHSLLGARRTLSLLSVGESSRPVRKTRGRGHGDRARDRVHISRPSEVTTTETVISRQEVFGSEELCSVPAYSSDVVFLKTDYEDSPASVQGDRESRVLCEVDPNLPVTSDLSSSSSASSYGDSETETCSESEDTFASSHTASITSPPCHHDNQPTLSRPPPNALTVLSPGRRSEVARRQLVHLLCSSSPLVGENLKVLLGPEAYERLSSGQRRQLLSLLPTVDVDSADRIHPVALSNSFFGSACREWQDHLTLGLHSNTVGRARVEKKARSHDNTYWKDKFFETNWGERLSEPVAGDGDHVYFPCESDPTSPLTSCLEAILDGYHCRVQPDTPSLPPPPSPPPPPPPPAPPPSLPPPPQPPAKPFAGERKPVTVPLKLSSGDSCLKSRPRSRPAGHRPRKSAAGKEQSSQLDNRTNRHRPPARRLGRNSRNNLVPFKNKKASGSMYLSPLPHKMSYSALLEALHKASRQQSMPAPPDPLTDCSPSPLTVHPHSVFLDHFSTLHAHSVPAKFLTSPPSPPSSLLVCLPRAHYTTVLAHRAMLLEHSYTTVSPDPMPTLPLSLPRSLFPPPSPHNSGECSSNKLTFCSTCNSLYHANCSHGNLCPSCLKKPSLT